MPLFEFKCKKCGKKFEELANSSTKDETVNCPHCGSERTEKIMSTFCSGTKSADQGGSSGCAPKRGGG